MCTTDSTTRRILGFLVRFFLHEDFAETNGCGAHFGNCSCGKSIYCVDVLAAGLLVTGGVGAGGWIGDLVVGVWVD
ncbi:hypothetical protein BJX66DRAFT_304260 [Aspergillus keveii]|jgi:hypothetical protein|uniref:Uncharacterized protein n=1 Tax=Aspergillus keveii TaxID=714993 RepID=A0ABR4G5E0_9EURO